jgi:predicted nucleotidyltransferase component of viral defense system
MSRPQPQNLAASVGYRLRELSRQRGEDFQLTLTHFAIERLLYRLSQSEEASQFIVKGAILFAVWTGQVYRPTRDLDLLGFGEATGSRLKKLFQNVCRRKVLPDGLEFDPTGITVEPIREVQKYPGQRVRIIVHLGKAEIKLQIDIAFGDAVVPKAKSLPYPTLLGFPAPTIRAYPKESVVAEKLQAIVVLAMINSRMKDFYDLEVLARQFAFDGELLVKAIKATFLRRGTPLPVTGFIAFEAEFYESGDKRTQWRAFLGHNDISDEKPELGEVVGRLKKFLLPPLKAAAADKPFPRHWAPGGPWKAIG